MGVAVSCDIHLTCETDEQYGNPAVVYILPKNNTYVLVITKILL